MLCCTCFVNDVDGGVWQLAVVDIAVRKLNRGFDRIGGVFHAVVILKVWFDPFEDFLGIFDRRLVHVDLLEAAREGAVLLEVLAELFVGSGTHGA